MGVPIHSSETKDNKRKHELKKATGNNRESEIDDIFAKRPKQQSSSQDKLQESKKDPIPTTKAKNVPPVTVFNNNSLNLGSRQNKRQNLTETDIAFADSRGTQSKRCLTDDGHPIFSVEELNIGKGGETKDCPFDCSCCF